MQQIATKNVEIRNTKQKLKKLLEVNLCKKITSQQPLFPASE